MSYCYLLFDAADGAILAEHESAQDARAAMEQLQSEQPQRDVRVALFGQHRGELIGTRAVATARALTAAEGLARYRRRRA